LSPVTATTPSMMLSAPGMAPLLPKLRGQLAEFLDQCSLDRLGILYLPTCVGFGYGCQDHSLETFLGSRGSPTYAITPQPVRPPDLPRSQPTRLAQVNHRLGWATFLRHPLAHSTPQPPPVPQPPRRAARLGWVYGCFVLARSQQYRNINRSSIDYASRPRLRPRLTLGG
jgi:hypothetical protein